MGDLARGGRERPPPLRDSTLLQPDALARSCEPRGRIASFARLENREATGIIIFPFSLYFTDRK
jgi:hypothetical protein